MLKVMILLFFCDRYPKPKSFICYILFHWMNVKLMISISAMSIKQ